MTTSNVAAEDALASLGFSEIESRVYAFLLSGSPATGYRVSHGIGKPTANTYKAIASLQDKGALIVDEGENRLCRAVPPDELLTRLERTFEEQRRQAATVLSELYRPEADDRVYRLTNPEQVLERARKMLERAQTIALLDLFPEPFEALRPSLIEASRRGVQVALKVYASSEVPGARVVLDSEPGRILGQWPGQQLSLVVDAREHLLALLAPGLEEVRQAIWSPSLFLSSMHHNHVASEILLTLQDGLLSRPKGETVLEDARQITVLRARPPGMVQLQEQYEPRQPKSRSSRNHKRSARGKRAERNGGEARRAAKRVKP